MCYSTCDVDVMEGRNGGLREGEEGMVVKCAGREEWRVHTLVERFKGGRGSAHRCGLEGGEVRM